MSEKLGHKNNASQNKNNPIADGFAKLQDENWQKAWGQSHLNPNYDESHKITGEAPNHSNPDYQNHFADSEPEHSESSPISTEPSYNNVYIERIDPNGGFTKDIIGVVATEAEENDAPPGLGLLDGPTLILSESTPPRPEPEPMPDPLPPAEPKYGSSSWGYNGDTHAGNRSGNAAQDFRPHSDQEKEDAVRRGDF